MVADAMEKVTNDGVITIEESKTMKTELDLVEGMQFDRGYISAYMCTDMEKMEATLAIWSLLLIGSLISAIALTASSVAFFIPFLNTIGFAPAARFFIPSFTIACAQIWRRWRQLLMTSIS